MTKERVTDERLAALYESVSDRAAEPTCGMKEDIDIARALRELQERRAAEPKAPLAVTRWWNGQQPDCPKPGDKCAQCGGEWLPDPSSGTGVWHNCHT